MKQLTPKQSNYSIYFLFIAFMFNTQFLNAQGDALISHGSLQIVNPQVYPSDLVIDLNAKLVDEPEITDETELIAVSEFVENNLGDVFDDFSLTWNSLKSIIDGTKYYTATADFNGYTGIIFTAYMEKVNEKSLLRSVTLDFPEGANAGVNLIDQIFKTEFASLIPPSLMDAIPTIKNIAFEMSDNKKITALSGTVGIGSNSWDFINAPGFVLKKVQLSVGAKDLEKGKEERSLYVGLAAESELGQNGEFPMIVEGLLGSKKAGQDTKKDFTIRGTIKKISVENLINACGADDIDFVQSALSQIPAAIKEFPVENLVASIKPIDRKISMIATTKRFNLEMGLENKDKIQYTFGIQLTDIDEITELIDDEIDIPELDNFKNIDLAAYISTAQGPIVSSLPAFNNLKPFRFVRGLNFIGVWTPGQEMEAVDNLILTAQIPIDKGIAPTAINFKGRMESDIEIGENFLTLNGVGVELNVDALDLFFGVNGDISIHVGDDTDLNLRGTIKIEPLESEAEGELLLRAVNNVGTESGWEKPFGIPGVTFFELGLSVGGGPVFPHLNKMGATGEMSIGLNEDKNRKIKGLLTADIDGNTPHEFYFEAAINQLSIGDILEAFTMTEEFTLEGSGFPEPVIKAFGTGLENAHVVVSTSAQTIFGKPVKRQLFITGDFKIWDTNASVDFNVLPKQYSINGEGTIDPITLVLPEDLTNNLLKDFRLFELKAATGKEKPSIKFGASLSEFPNFSMNGKISLFNDLITTTTDLKMGQEGIYSDHKTTFLNKEVDLKFTLDPDFDNPSISGSGTIDPLEIPAINGFEIFSFNGAGENTKPTIEFGGSKNIFPYFKMNGDLTILGINSTTDIIFEDKQANLKVTGAIGGENGLNTIVTAHIEDVTNLTDGSFGIKAKLVNNLQDQLKTILPNALDDLSETTQILLKKVEKSEPLTDEEKELLDKILSDGSTGLAWVAHKIANGLDVIEIDSVGFAGKLNSILSKSKDNDSAINFYITGTAVGQNINVNFNVPLNILTLGNLEEFAKFIGPAIITELNKLVNVDALIEAGVTEAIKGYNTGISVIENTTGWQFTKPDELKANSVTFHAQASGYWSGFKLQYTDKNGVRKDWEDSATWGHMVEKEIPVGATNIKAEICKCYWWFGKKYECDKTLDLGNYTEGNSYYIWSSGATAWHVGGELETSQTRTTATFSELDNNSYLILYNDYNLSGPKFNLTEDQINVNSMSINPFGDPQNIVKSMKVAKGYKIAVYKNGTFQNLATEINNIQQASVDSIVIYKPIEYRVEHESNKINYVIFLKNGTMLRSSGINFYQNEREEVDAIQFASRDCYTKECKDELRLYGGDFYTAKIGDWDKPNLVNKSQNWKYFSPLPRKDIKKAEIDIPGYIAQFGKTYVINNLDHEGNVQYVKIEDGKFLSSNARYFYPVDITGDLKYIAHDGSKWTAKILTDGVYSWSGEKIVVGIQHTSLEDGYTYNSNSVPYRGEFGNHLVYQNNRNGTIIKAGRVLNYDFEWMAEKENLAYGKPTNFSSTHARSQPSGVSVNGLIKFQKKTAVLINSELPPIEPDLNFTNKQKSPWWEVDLGSTYDIRVINIYSREDGYTWRQKTLKIAVSPFPFSSNADGETFATTGGQSFSGLKNFTGNAFGRYVRIYLDTEIPEHLSLNEVEVYGEEPTNLALNKQVAQSSTGWNAPASYANDGNTDGDFNKKSVTHTSGVDVGWWEVDLGGYYDIEKIMVYNRTDGSSNRLNNFTIRTSLIPFTSNNDGYIYAGNLSTPEYGYGMYLGNSAARYVRVHLDQPQVLSLAEVEVYGQESNILNDLKEDLLSSPWRKDVIGNDYHRGSFTELENGDLQWTNKAGWKWSGKFELNKNVTWPGSHGPLKFTFIPGYDGIASFTIGGLGELRKYELEEALVDELIATPWTIDNWSLGWHSGKFTDIGNGRVRWTDDNGFRWEGRPTSNQETVFESLDDIDDLAFLFNTEAYEIISFQIFGKEYKKKYD